MNERLLEILRIALAYRVSDIHFSLAENGGNQSLTARRLGISRSTLWRYLGGGAKAPGNPPAEK